MKPEPRQEDCFICRVGSGLTNIPAMDRPLRLEPRVGIMLPGAGALDGGYVLICPTQHFTTIRDALSENPGFLDFINTSLNLYRGRIGPYSFWEHGSGSSCLVSRSACIDHAHLHVVPKQDFSLPPDGVLFPELSEMDLDSEVLANGPYLLYGASDESIIVGPDPRVSQYYRREWALLLGLPDHWDYALGDVSAAQKSSLLSLLGGDE